MPKNIRFINSLKSKRILIRGGIHSITEIRKKFHIYGEVIDKCVKIIGKKGQKLRT